MASANAIGSDGGKGRKEFGSGPKCKRKRKQRNETKHNAIRRGQSWTPFFRPSPLPVASEEDTFYVLRIRGELFST